MRVLKGDVRVAVDRETLKTKVGRYGAFVQTSGVFALLWSLAAGTTFSGWWLSLTPLTIAGTSYERACALRAAWYESCDREESESFPREGLEDVRRWFYRALDDAAKSAASYWMRELRGDVGRNDPCPCGSGLKVKRCHGSVPGFAWLCEHPFDGRGTQGR
jgi:hypothetical protein